MAKILVFSEKKEMGLLSKGWELSAGGGGGQGVAAVASSAEGMAEYFSYGANPVYQADGDHTAAEETWADLLRGIVERGGFQLVLLTSTKRGKEIAARLAYALGAGCVTDVTSLRWEGERLLADRYTLGGNCVATEEILTPVKVCAVMPYAFPVGQPDPARRGDTVVVTLPGESQKRVIERRAKAHETVRLEEAERIVGVGKGLLHKEDLEMVMELAGVLGAEVGCSKPLALELHWFSEDRIIGLTGSKASPKLYLALGVSGQIQHMVGVGRAKTIVAINKSADAPIFKGSDYGIVGDLYQVVPKLVEELKKA
ncbi:MAG: electron transfer flavoprotein subunit alpha/FixB family protein [Chloroflexi bacterium]|nr:electron transfer flavoprotein subunit alpha/FixB family protein [Chloroflexota bacterium]